MRRRARHLTWSVAVAVLLAGCGRAEDGGPALPEPADDPAPPVVITVVHDLTGVDAATGLLTVLDLFRDGNDDIIVEEFAVTDVAAHFAAAGTDAPFPDVVISQDVRLLRRLAEDGRLQRLDGSLDRMLLSQQVVPGTLDPMTIDGALLGVPVRLDLASLVWFDPALFAARSLAIPTTWDALVALGDALLADGITPWCIGIEAGPATGWVAADWFEDVLVRELDPDALARWTRGELAFAAPEVIGALERTLVPLWTDEQRVLGGPGRIVTEYFGTSLLGILGPERSCALHRQGALAEAFLLDHDPTLEVGVDVDAFLLPGRTAADRPVLGSAHYAALSGRGDRGEAGRRLVQFLADPVTAAVWAATGEHLSPFAPVLDASVHPTASQRRLHQLLADATSFHLQVAARLPARVAASGAPGSLWAELTAWTAGERDLLEALTAVDELLARQPR